MKRMFVVCLMAVLLLGSGVVFAQSGEKKISCQVLTLADGSSQSAFGYTFEYAAQAATITVWQGRYRLEVLDVQENLNRRLSRGDVELLIQIFESQVSLTVTDLPPTEFDAP